MATTLTLRILAAPLTRHHLVAALHSSNGSGFGAEEHQLAALDKYGEEISDTQVAEAVAADGRLIELYNAACTAIAEDADYQAAIAGIKVHNRWVGSLSPKMQFFALAPNLRICESSEVPQDHKIWSITERGQTISIHEIDTILDAITYGDHNERTLHQAKDFLLNNYGAQGVVMGD